MRIEIRTSGGFSGGGIGNVTIEDASGLRELIDLAIHSGAPVSSPARGATAPPYGAATPVRTPAPHLSSRDEVTYTMTVGDRTFTWTDSAPAAPPVLALFDAAWRTRYP